MHRTRFCDFRTRPRQANNHCREFITQMDIQQNLVESLRQQVASLTARLHQQITSRQEARDRTLQRALMDRDALHQEILELRDLLGKERADHMGERAGRIQLSQELDETRRQLAHQRHLKDVFIKKDKETRKKLEMVRKYTDNNTISTTKIATQVRDKIKQKKKKLLQKDYEELKVAHILSQDKFEAELQAEREKNNLLNQELERIKLSHEEGDSGSSTGPLLLATPPGRRTSMHCRSSSACWVTGRPMEAWAWLTSPQASGAKSIGETHLKRYNKRQREKTTDLGLNKGLSHI
ncbi:uncharacterized protein LOC109955950 [Scomber scombrus]|uniref:Uncharacterized protein LOC109955950 n=1 Tax=Scomber scombrus TaxID=13677 RepID=A0AAV1PIE1_SCOSC